MNPACWLENAAIAHPQAPALMLGADILCDYAGFNARVATLAGALRAQGVAPGDRVAIFRENHPDYLTALLAIWRAGAAAAPINAKLHGREAAWIIADAGVKRVFASAKTAPALAEAGFDPVLLVEDSPAADPLPIHPMRGEELVWLFYTSGTTGRPKGVMITSSNLQAMCLGYFAHMGRPAPGDHWLYAAPMSHGAGLYGLPALIGGAAHAVAPSGGFDAAETLALARRLGRVSMFAAPTMVRRMVDAANGAPGEGLDTVIYAGGPMYLADIEEAVATLGPRFAQIYGQGECPMAITALSRDQVADRAHPRWRARLGSVGRAQCVTELRVVDDQMQDVAQGEAGEVVARGAAVMAGYWRNQEATAETIRDGWLRTGDVGQLDADGFLTLLDRSRDLVISGGTNIYPREVEEALLAHPQVAEAAVIGLPDPEWGEIVCAAIVGDATEAALDAHCRDLIARFKRPKRYAFVEALPKNNYGKVVKRALRERAASLFSD